MAGRVFLTGGTGFVGSNILYELLRLGYEVICLLRESKGISPRERLEIPLKVIDPSFSWNQYSDKIIMMAGDICLPKLGLSAEDLAWLKTNKPQSIFHCAGSIMFPETEAEKNKTWETNVEGTRNIIALSKELCSPHIFYISTAYVAGNLDGFYHEEIKCPDGFNNYYEETKLHGEIAVRGSGLPYSILRPGIVVADKKGHILSCTGYYMCANLFWMLKKNILAHWEKEPHYYDGSGINVVGDRLILPVNFERRFQAKLNLVPVDWLARAIILLSEKKNLCEGQVFHLTHPNPPDIEDVIKNSMDILGINVVKIVDAGVKATHQNRILNGIQKKVNEGLKYYLPYTGQNISFSTFHTKSVLNSSYTAPPPIDRAFLERTLNYAIEHNFKR